MGQQQTVTGNALRRMIMLVAVVALMAAMLAVNAMPVRQGSAPQCQQGLLPRLQPPWNRTVLV